MSDDLIGMKEVKERFPIPINGQALYALSGAGLFPDIYSRPKGRTETKWVRAEVEKYFQEYRANSPLNNKG